MKTAPAIAGTLAIQTLAALALYGIAVFAPVAAPAYGVRESDVGTFTAAVYVVAMAAGLVTGGFVLRYGAIRVGQATLVLGAAGMAAFASGSPWMLLPAVLLLGFNYGPVNPLSSDVLARVATPRNRPFVFSIKQTGVPLGGVMAGALLPPIILFAGWQAAALAVAAFAILLALAVQPLRRDFDAGRLPGHPLGAVRLWQPLATVFRDPTALRLAILASIYSGVQVSLMSFLVVYLAGPVAMTLVDAGFVYAACQGGGIVGRLLWGGVAERWVRSRPVLVGLGLAAACLGVALTRLPAGVATGPAAVLAFLLGSTGMGWNGVYLSEVIALAPPDKALDMTGGAQFYMFAGAFILPPAFGAVVAATGRYEPAFYMLAACGAFAALLAATARKPAPTSLS